MALFVYPRCKANCISTAATIINLFPKQHLKKFKKNIFQLKTEDKQKDSNQSLESKKSRSIERHEMTNYRFHLPIIIAAKKLFIFPLKLVGLYILWFANQKYLPRFVVLLARYVSGLVTLK